jgi:predicted RNA binding protein YcfA (HicA-like mRNA interferase family)
MLRDSHDIIQRLRRDGYELVSVKGSHHKFRHPATRRMTIVPHPKRDMAKGTVKAIYAQAGWKKD